MFSTVSPSMAFNLEPPPSNLSAMYFSIILRRALTLPIGKRYARHLTRHRTTISVKVLSLASPPSSSLFCFSISFLKSAYTATKVMDSDSTVIPAFSPPPSSLALSSSAWTTSSTTSSSHSICSSEKSDRSLSDSSSCSPWTRWRLATHLGPCLSSIQFASSRPRAKLAS